MAAQLWVSEPPPAADLLRWVRPLPARMTASGHVRLEGTRLQCALAAVRVRDRLWAQGCVSALLLSEDDDLLPPGVHGGLWASKVFGDVGVRGTWWCEAEGGERLLPLPADRRTMVAARLPSHEVFAWLAADRAALPPHVLPGRPPDGCWGGLLAVVDAVSACGGQAVVVPPAARLGGELVERVPLRSLWTALRPNAGETVTELDVRQALARRLGGRTAGDPLYLVLMDDDDLDAASADLLVPHLAAGRVRVVKGWPDPAAAVVSTPADGRLLSLLVALGPDASPPVVRRVLRSDPAALEQLAALVEKGVVERLPDGTLCCARSVADLGAHQVHEASTAGLIDEWARWRGDRTAHLVALGTSVSSGGAPLSDWLGTLEACGAWHRLLASTEGEAQPAAEVAVSRLRAASALGVSEPLSEVAGWLEALGLRRGRRGGWSGKVDSPGAARAVVLAAVGLAMNPLVGRPDLAAEWLGALTALPGAPSSREAVRWARILVVSPTRPPSDEDALQRAMHHLAHGRQASAARALHEVSQAPRASAELRLQVAVHGVFASEVVGDYAGTEAWLGMLAHDAQSGGRPGWHLVADGLAVWAAGQRGEAVDDTLSAPGLLGMVVSVAQVQAAFAVGHAGERHHAQLRVLLEGLGGRDTIGCVVGRQAAGQLAVVGALQVRHDRSLAAPVQQLLRRLTPLTRHDALTACRVALATGLLQHRGLERSLVALLDALEGIEARSFVWERRVCRQALAEHPSMPAASQQAYLP